MKLTPSDFYYLALCLEGCFFGLYSGIFAMHLQHHASKDNANSKQNIIFYALCVLYVLSAVVIALDTAFFVAENTNDISLSMTYHLEIAQLPVLACCDFIAQFILIYRCWIVWGRNIRVVILPSILAFAFLVMWIASIGAEFIGKAGISETMWGNTLVLTGLTVSMTVNALVTGLIVFRIFKVFREVKGITTSVEKHLGVTGGRKIRSSMFVIIESGMALFAIQLARLVISAPGLSTAAEGDAFILIATGIHQMLNGITPTIILVRVSMGLSFHDDTSLVEVAGSLQFAADDPNPIRGTGNISQDESLRIVPDDSNPIPDMVNISQERRDDDIGASDDIQMVDR